MGPTAAESPTRACSSNYGTVTGGSGATVALSHPSTAAHAASSARGCRLKRRAHTAPHESGHVAPHQLKTRARGSRLCDVFRSRQNIPSWGLFTLEGIAFRGLTDQGVEAWPFKGFDRRPRSPESGLQGCAIQATLERGVRDIPRSVQGQTRVPRRGIPSRESIEPSNPTEWVRAPPSEPSRALYETCLWTTSRPLSNGARTSA